MSQLGDSTGLGTSQWRMNRAGRVMVSLSGVFGLLGILGVTLGIRDLASVKEEYLPIAPSSAFVIIVLSAMMLASFLRPTDRMARVGIAIGSIFVLVFCISLITTFLTQSSFDIEKSLFGYTKFESGVELGHMSPVAMVGYVLLAVGLLVALLWGRRQWAGQFAVFMGGGAFAIGLVSSLGYVYGSPLLYGGNTRPIALWASASMGLLGVALMCLPGPTFWPARIIVGPSVRARLQRTFPPITVVIVLGIAWLFRQTEGSSNPAILASLIALVSAVIVALVVSKIAQTIGGEIDRTNAELKATQESLLTSNARLSAKTNELSAVNRELEAFSYSVSHDLRSPLTHIQGFAGIVSEEYGSNLDDKGKEYLRKVLSSAQRMNALIEDLLNLSRVSRNELQLQNIDLADIARAVADRLKHDDPGRKVSFNIVPHAPALADPRLIEVALENLLGNSWKFTSKNAEANIEFSVSNDGARTTYVVRDDGAGFDMKHYDRLFVPFQRLHSSSEFAGTGVGLATVRRVINRHGGEIWAEAAPGKGATFYFTLSAVQSSEKPQRETISST